MSASKIRLMEVCGTHTMAVARSGIRSILPAAIELISGPGCPVCVTAPRDIERAQRIARIKGVIMTTFGDMLRVPGVAGSLEEAKRDGADVRVVYSCLDALKIAGANPRRPVIFMGIGFETTSPTVAATLIEAKRKRRSNFFVLSNFKLIFPALAALAQSPQLEIDGFICPGHVSVITGSAPYEQIARRYQKPCVITGFDADEIIRGISLLVEQIKKHTCRVEIAYTRAVKKAGNVRARRILAKVFRPCASEWRGLGVINASGLKLREEFSAFSAEKEFKMALPEIRPPQGCICGEVLRGSKTPRDCRLFKKRCRPQSPVGPCMVSSEGTCAADYKYG